MNFFPKKHRCQENTMATSFMIYSYISNHWWFPGSLQIWQVLWAFAHKTKTKNPTFPSVISEVFFCVCSEHFSENSKFPLCSRFKIYVPPSLLVVTLNFSSLGSTCSIVLRSHHLNLPAVFHLMQYLAARTRQKGSLPLCYPSTSHNINLAAEQTKQVLSVTAFIAICATKLQTLEKRHYL